MSTTAKIRKQYSAEFKAKVAFEAIKGQDTINQLSTSFGVHPNQIMTWKKQAQEAVINNFLGRTAKTAKTDEQLKEQLYSQIGQLKVELDWLKKKAGLFSW
jgi:transposase-like protein